MSPRRWILLEYPAFVHGAPPVDEPAVDPSCPIWIPDAELPEACVYCGRVAADHEP
jgi:hypothetical protein